MQLRGDFDNHTNSNTYYNDRLKPHRQPIDHHLQDIVIGRFDVPFCILRIDMTETRGQQKDY